MMADDDIEPLDPTQDEVSSSVQARKADIEMRATLADTYTFVRSREINKTIASFTFDHYIDEAKRAIKEDRILQSASNPAQGVGTRASKLSALTKLQQDFTNALVKIKKVAEAKDSSTEGTPQ